MSDHVDCPVCGKTKPSVRIRLGRALPGSVQAVLQRVRPEWSPDDGVCADCVADAKVEHLREMLEADGELTEDESEVLESIRTESILTTDGEQDFEAEDMADPLVLRLAKTFGSWPFLGLVVTFLIVWIVWNVTAQPFEPYPVIVFAVTSAVLASAAAIQGPIIIMSQRQQRERDRLRARADYRINLKAELEIQYLDEKVDMLLERQARLAEDRDDAGD
ncbi:MAG: DUF1003 domain-containing protein [Actinomycetota bacterium]